MELLLRNALLGFYEMGFHHSGFVIGKLVRIKTG